MVSDTSLLDAESDLVNRFMANLPAGYVAADIDQPNAPFTTPDTGFIRLTTVALAIEELEASGNCELQTGIFVTDIFVPKDSGSRAALLTAKTIKDLYHGQTFGVTSVSLVQVVPRGIDENWHHVQVNIYFNFQTIFSGV